MTRTGIFMRCKVRTKESFHCTALSLRTNPDRMAATNTPVPAADSQLMTNFAASGLALMGATGGIRCTRLFNDGMSQTGSERVPTNGEPSSVVVKVTPEKRLFRYFLKSGKPQIAQQRISITHGSHAYTVSAVVYLYFHSVLSVVAVAVLLPALANASRSDLSMKRVFGCQTKRRYRAVQITENTPETTSVI